MIDLFHTHSPPTNVLFVVLLCGNPSFTQHMHIQLEPFMRAMNDTQVRAIKRAFTVVLSVEACRVLRSLDHLLLLFFLICDVDTDAIVIMT